MGDNPRVALVDLSGIYWANWHATADMEVSEAFVRTVAQVAALRSKGDLIAICCDAPPYLRREILPTYKANREAAPPMAVEQFRRVKERLRADGLLLWESQGFEADDVIAWATSHALDAGHKVTIASGDKDLHQLIGPDVECFSPQSQTTYDAAAAVEKHGVYPAQMADYLALVGDSSDNVPGVPGIGPKTAAALLGTFRTLDGVLAEAAKEHGEITKPKLKASLVEYAETARLSRKVITLRFDVPLNWEEIYMERTPENLTEPDESAMDDEALPEATPAAVVAAPAALAKHPEPRSAIVDAGWSLALEPRTQRGAWEAAGLLLNSRLYAKFGTQEAIYAVIVRGRALGMDATTSLAVFHNIQGKLTMHADLIEALVLRSGKAEYFEMTHSDAKVATYATKRVGGRGEQSLSFTIEDALRAGLVTKDDKGQDGYLGISESGKPSNWDKYRSTMLRHRCKTQLARAVYSDVVLGLYSPDELDDGATTVAE